MLGWGQPGGGVVACRDTGRQRHSENSYHGNWVNLEN